MPETTVRDILESIHDAEATNAALEDYRQSAYPPAYESWSGELKLVFPEDQ